MDDIRRSDALKLLVRKLSLRSTLSRDETHVLRTLPGEVVTLKAQVDFVHAGDPVQHACLVREGLVARSEQLEDGRRQIVSLHVPGDFVDLQSLLLSCAPASLQTICPSTIVRIPHTALNSAIAQSPALAMALWRDTVIDANVMAQAVVRVGRRDAYGRVAHLFCEMARRYDDIGQLKGGSFQFAITQEQLADALGLTQVHVNRTLRALRQDGLVAFGSGHVKLHDWPGLRQVATFDPSYLGVVRPEQASGRVA